jgi:DNA polymerase-3 subunit alpha
LSAIGLHNHCDRGSNIRLLDTTNKVEDMFITAHEQGYKGLAITDHESVSAHVKAIQSVRKLKDKGKLPMDFKLILGNEIYLLMDSYENVSENYKSGETKFPHFLLLATNKKAHEILRLLSSRAWERSFHTGMMERVPTLKSDLEELVKPNQGLIIGSTACLGSESSIYLMNAKLALENNDQKTAQINFDKTREFLKWGIETFGREYFYLELQPALSEEQIFVNKELVKFSDELNLKMIITTDSHFLRPEDRVIHKAFLNSKQADREVDSFYEACFIQNVKEIYERMNYLEKSIISESINNTLLIGDLCEDYTIEHDPIIPKIELPEFELSHMFKQGYEQYGYLGKMAYSDNEQDRYMIKSIEDGFQEYIPYKTLTKEKFHQILARINMELGELWEISTKLNQAMTSYYITIREIINIIWDDCGGNSLVGSGRGSAAGFLINYLLGITQVNPLEYGIELPHWRHLHKSRPDIPDIDIDTEANKRPQIIKALRDRFGSNKVLQVCTFGTEKSKSALQTACRGLEYDSDIGLHLSGMIPFERGENWSLTDCFFGNEEEGRKPIKAFINEVEKYPNLKETALKIEGLVNKRSIHAGGVIIFNDDYYKSNAMMKAPNGDPITQYNLGDSEAVGNVKLDLLTIKALDKIRATLDMLVEHEEIEWTLNLRKTFDHYLHPDNIEKVDTKIYEMLGSGEILDLFQFSTDIGIQTSKKVKPKNLLETASANSLMRLMSDGDEQPIDVFVKYKNDISIWYREMKEFGLNDDEINIMEEHLLKLNGVADTQESVMLISMDERVAGFDVKLANKLRKAIAKRSKEALEEVESEFFKGGERLGTRSELLDYVWNVQIKRQLGYAFSILHTLAYSLVAVQEVNLNYKYNPLYWQTACLTVNSGSGDEANADAKNKSTDYGKVASAIGNIMQRGISVSLPSINKAGFGFKPDLKNNSIIYGLKGINGIGDEIVHEIIKNRPYESFDDFYEKLYKTKLVKKGHVKQLIKAGSFDEFGDRVEMMKTFLLKEFSPNQTLTTANLSKAIDMGIIPEELSHIELLFNFKKYISKSVHKTLTNPKDKILKLDHNAIPYFQQHFTEDSVVDNDGTYIYISEKLFKKEYDTMMEQGKEWLSQDSTVRLFNQSAFLEEWETHASGTVSQWEMDSVSFYHGEHELEHVDSLKYSLSKYSDLPETPVVTKEKPSKKDDRVFYEYDLSRIVGTVLDSDKNKHTVSLLTPDGVVAIKFYGNTFSQYSKQISEKNSKGKKTVLEKSWFTRGNKLLLTGYRRGNQFIPKVYRNSVYKHAIALINNVEEDGSIIMTTERIRN